MSKSLKIKENNNHNGQISIASLSLELREWRRPPINLSMVTWTKSSSGHGMSLYMTSGVTISTNVCAMCLATSADNWRWSASSATELLPCWVSSFPEWAAAGWLDERRQLHIHRASTNSWRLCITSICKSPIVNSALSQSVTNVSAAHVHFHGPELTVSAFSYMGGGPVLSHILP